MSKYKGSNFDDFLADEDLLADVQAEAVKRVIAWELQQLMNERNLSKAALASQLHTSRAGLDRLLDEKNLSVTLNSMVNVARATGKKLQLSFV